MDIPQDAIALRIYTDESQKWHHQPLYEAIVMKAREMNLSGATVLRGSMGYGKSCRIHTSKILNLSMNLPFIIEIVDSKENIEAFLPVIDEMIGSGLVTLEERKVIHYRGGKK